MDSLLLSARDMSDEENVKDAAFELDRCHDAESYKRWCERWARALIARAHLLAGAHEELQGEVEETRKALRQVAQDIGGVIGNLESSVSQIEDIL